MQLCSGGQQQESEKMVFEKDAKPAGIKRKDTRHKQRNSTLERHRQSYIRAWNAIQQARQESTVNSSKPSTQHGLDQGQLTSSKSTEQLQTPLCNVVDSVDNARAEKTSVEGSKNRKKRSGSRGRLSSPFKESANVQMAHAASKPYETPATPEPAKAEHELSDDNSSQISGSGLFVTPNAPSIWHETPFQNIPRLISFPKSKSRRELALVVSAPDLPRVEGVSKESLKTAARKTFGPKTERKVQQSGPGVWSVKLVSQEEARDGVRKRLLIGGSHFVAEKIPKAPSKVFVWKPGEDEVVPSGNEMADNLWRTFGPRRPEVKVQEVPRQVSLTFSECPNLLRLYLPMAEGRHARFDPVWPA